jgi:UPF0042 nucleotide-binding protein
VLITGMSGAGRTIVLRRFEDMGFYCVDNLPPALLPQLAEVCQREKAVTKVACVADLRGGPFFAGLADNLRKLDEAGLRACILFLDANDEALVRRFKETRRRHPLFNRRRGILESIKAERDMLKEVRAMADKVIDTSALLPKDLRSEVAASFGDKHVEGPTITLRSFGFKYGLPLDVDIVFDVRHLVNPHWEPGLRELDGRSPEVAAFMDRDPATLEYLEKLYDLVKFSIPRHIAEGRAYLTVGVGCTGGQHRSVLVAERIGAFLEKEGYRAVVQHRDVSK